MSKITPQFLIDNLKNAQGLPEEDVKKWLERLQNMTELDLETFEEYKQFLQDALDKKFAEAGVELDENDPEYKAAYNEMKTEIQAATDDFAKEMDEIKKAGQALQKNASDELDQVDLQAAQDKIKTIK